MHKERLERHCKDNFPLSVVITDTDENVPIHSHDFIELVFFVNGVATHNILRGGKNVCYPVMQGDFFSIMPKEKHSYDSSKAHYYNIIFSPELISNELHELKEFRTWNSFFGMNDLEARFKVHLTAHDRMEMEQYIKRLRNELAKRAAGYKICARSILLEILLIVLRCTPKRMLHGVKALKSDNDILNIINEMEKNPEKHYCLKELAKKANMCISGFTKKFRNLIGTSPTEYLLSLRIEKAEQLLLSSSSTIYTIAEQCGFYDINYFIKVFRRFRGLTPAKFRRQNKVG